MRPSFPMKKTCGGAFPEAASLTAAQTPGFVLDAPKKPEVLAKPPRSASSIPKPRKVAGKSAHFCGLFAEFCFGDRPCRPQSMGSEGSPACQGVYSGAKRHFAQCKRFKASHVRRRTRTSAPTTELSQRKPKIFHRPERMPSYNDQEKSHSKDSEAATRPMSSSACQVRALSAISVNAESQSPE